MIKKKASLLIILLLNLFFLKSYAQKIDKYWKISSSKSIVWNVNKTESFPHGDNIEMSGKKVSAIIYYDVNKDKELSLKREIIYPQLRTIEEDWKKYRAYYKKIYADEIEPTIKEDGANLVFKKVDSVEINGKITFYHPPVQGIILKRTLFPSMNQRVFVENWELINTSEKKKSYK